jgi:hypothetical protein
LEKRKKLCPSTIAKHLNVVRKALTEARKRGYLKSLPPFPVVGNKDNPRPYFSTQEYRQLRIKAKSLAQEGLSVRGVPMTEEIYDFIVFGMNVFVRPSDQKLLSHRDAEVVKHKKEKSTVQ